MRAYYSRDPDLTWLVKERQFLLNSPFTVTWWGTTWTIPAGFKTDLASIPRGFLWLIPKMGRHVQAAIAHDWFYEMSRDPSPTALTRKQVDQMFLDGMKSLGVSWWKRRTMHAAVRAAGWYLWEGG